MDKRPIYQPSIIQITWNSQPKVNKNASQCLDGPRVVDFVKIVHLGGRGSFWNYFKEVYLTIIMIIIILEVLLKILEILKS